MTIRGKGAVVLMTSLAGFQGSGYLAVYAATKLLTGYLQRVCGTNGKIVVLIL